MLEKISLSAKRKRMLKTLATLLGDVGFNKVEYEKGSLTLEKVKEDLQGNKYAEYSIILGSKSIDFSYTVDKTTGLVQRKLEMLPLFFDVLVLAKDYYEVNPTELFAIVSDIITAVKPMLNKEAVDMLGELNETKEKHATLARKYEEVVRSSEENSRLLLEAEQRYHELASKVQQLQGFSDEVLKAELYEWVRMHNGAIDMQEFAKTHNLSYGRVEEGLNMLIREGYIKKK